jgi:2-phosphosulfolactate phosphatase
VPDKPPVYVHLLPSLIPPRALRGGVAIVIDVLRATTVMVHALASGCQAIMPCLEIEEARALAESLGRDRTILAGERRGEPIEGFDLGNSPSTFTPEVCAGKTVVMTTTNGTKAILACLEAERVLVAGFVNRSATIGAASATGLPMHFVCSGTDGMVSLEDSLLAGYFCEIGRDFAIEIANDSARIALAYGREEIKGWFDRSTELVDAYKIGPASERVERIRSLFSNRIADVIRQGRGGRRNLELGLDSDIRDAARLDRFDIVAELQRDPIRIVRSP